MPMMREGLSKAKQSKAKQSKAKQSKAKQSKALTDGALFVDLIVGMTGRKEYRSQSDISVF